MVFSSMTFVPLFLPLVLILYFGFRRHSEKNMVLLLFSLLPASYLAPGLGRTQKDLTMSSGVCSVTTLFTLLAFCAMAFFLA